MIKKGPGLLLVLLAVVLFVFGVFVVPKPAPTEENTKPPIEVKTKLNLNEFQFAQTHEFDELVAEVQRDIEQLVGREIKITVIVGPYFRFYGLLAFLDDLENPYYYLGLDNRFMNELTEGERNSVVIHELGHILYRYPIYPDYDQRAEVEVKADGFVSKYTKYAGAKDAISALDKAHRNYTTRRMHLEKLAREQSH